MHLQGCGDVRQGREEPVQGPLQSRSLLKTTEASSPWETPGEGGEWASEVVLWRGRNPQDLSSHSFPSLAEGGSQGH